MKVTIDLYKNKVNSAVKLIQEKGIESAARIIEGKSSEFTFDAGQGYVFLIVRCY